MNKTTTPALLILHLLATVFLLPSVQAADGTETVELEAISVVGTRRAVSVVTDTAIPIDIISGTEFTNQGNTDISNSLRTLVPSYNVNTQPISDEATFVRPANLRGLGPDQTLILLNGKRRHRAAVISFLGNGVSDGAQGADISVIPAIALKRVEVLRDSASAQYGSDAIAGVINFVLKDRPEGGVITTQWGQTYEGDGADYRISGNIGLPLTERGFINLSAEWHEAEETVRSVQRTDAQNQINAGNTAIEQPYAQIWGQPEVDDDWKTFINAGFDLNDNVKFYAFGNYAQRAAEGGFFFRNPDGEGARNGVFRQGDNRLFLPDHPTTALRRCTPTQTNTANIVDGKYDTSQAPTGCFTFNERFPGGFRPKFKGNLTDFAGTGGVKGAIDELNYDVSYTYGKNQIDFSIRDTINASYGLDTPTQFELGSYIQTEQTVNIDLNYPFTVQALASPLYVASGFEWRNEQFEIEAGEPSSYADGGSAIHGASIGANGFSGFSDRVAGQWDRSNVAGYLDLEADIVEDLTLKVMGRFENYEDFDTNASFKTASLYQVNDYFGLRGSVGSGFRVPTVGQQNVQKVGTEFVGNELVDRATVQATSEYAQAFGAKALEAEKSFTFSVGLVADVGPISLTVDYFNIKVNDRIGKSKNYTRADNPAIFTNTIDQISGFLNSPGSISFLGNGFDTRTQGIDMTASMDADLSPILPFLANGTSTFSFAGNWTDTEVTSHNADFLDEKRLIQLEEALPNYRFNITLQHKQGAWSGLSRINYYGSYTEIHLNDLDLIIYPDSEVTWDLALGYTIMESLKLTAGADNILNNFPDRNPHASVAGSKYPESSPMGSNGGFYYFRVDYLF